MCTIFYLSPAHSQSCLQIIVSSLKQQHLLYLFTLLYLWHQYIPLTMHEAINKTITYAISSIMLTYIYTHVVPITNFIIIPSFLFPLQILILIAAMNFAILIFSNWARFYLSRNQIWLTKFWVNSFRTITIYMINNIWKSQWINSNTIGHWIFVYSLSWIKIICLFDIFSYKH